MTYKIINTFENVLRIDANMFFLLYKYVFYTKTPYVTCILFHISYTVKIYILEVSMM